MEKYVYFFGGGKADGNGTMKDVLGGKGSGLAEMTNAGLPVPPGFTIVTSACRLYFQAGNKTPADILTQKDEALAKLEALQGQKLGDAKNPLLVSVRSGAKFSMPGMMDTILNLGMNDTVVEVIAEKSGNPRFAYDSYRRFIQMFGNVVMEIPKEKFEHVFDAQKKKKRIKLDTDLTADDLKAVIADYKKVVRKEAGKDFPQDPQVQLNMSIEAVFRSWYNPRAATYRRMNKISDDLGTAVNVQTMVFGNMGDTSGTGVGFTRNPATGEKVFYGEYLMNAQGEDVVSGVRTPIPIKELEKMMPEVYNELRDIHYPPRAALQGRARLRVHHPGRQTLHAPDPQRQAHRAGGCADCRGNGEGRHPDPQGGAAARRARAVEPVATPGAGRKEGAESYCQGSAGIARRRGGARCFYRQRCGGEREVSPVVLVRGETVPDDIHGMEVAVGILTSRGGMTSHAAVVTRGMGKPCVAGCSEAEVDEKSKTIKVGSINIKEGDWISLDGSTGRVILGKADLVEPDPSSGVFAEFMKWADDARELGVRRERGHSARCSESGGVWRRGNWPLPYRTHVLRQGTAALRATHDYGLPGNRRPQGSSQQLERTARCPCQASAFPAQGLLRAVQGDGRAAGDHPHTRSAFARVLAEAGRVDGGDRYSPGDKAEEP